MKKPCNNASSQQYQRWCKFIFKADVKQRCYQPVDDC